MKKMQESIEIFFRRYFSFVKKYLPSHIQKVSLGLDIDSRFCRAVKLLRTTDGFKVAGWVIEPIGGADPGPCVKKILQEMNFSAGDVYTAVSGQGTLIRLIKMPQMPIEQIRESLALEADKYFPFPAAEIYIDCQIIEDKEGKDKKVPVLIAAAKKSIVNDRLNFLSSLSIQAETIGLNASAIANAVEKFHQKKEPALQKKEVFAILDMGEARTTLVIFRDNTARFTREITIGGKDYIIPSLEPAGSNLPKGQEQRPSLNDRFDGNFDFQKETMKNLASEIHLSLDYFNSEDLSQLKASSGDISPEDVSRVSKIFAVGDNANCKEALEFISQELEIPIDLWSPFGGLEFQDDAAKKEFLKHIHRLSIALGLAVTEND